MKALPPHYPLEQGLRLWIADVYHRGCYKPPNHQLEQGWLGVLRIAT